MELVTQKQAVITSFVQLVSDVGLPANMTFTLDGFPEVLPGREYLISVDKFIEIAQQYRPDLSSKKANILAKKASVLKALRDQWPVFTGTFNISDTDYVKGFNDVWQASGVIKVNFPLFAGWYYRNKIREAKSELKQAEASLKESEDTTLKEVVTYYNQYKYALERIAYTEAFLEAAIKEFEVTLSNYKTGTGDILKVLSAQSSLAKARSQQVESVKNLFTSLTNLAFSTGSLTRVNTVSNQPCQFELDEDTP